MPYTRRHHPYNRQKDLVNVTITLTREERDQLWALARKHECYIGDRLSLSRLIKAIARGEIKL